MKKGFTLAEVLITMGVIGIVATLTIPNVIQNYQNKVYVTSLQKAYNSISNAIVAFMADEMVDNLKNSSLTTTTGVYNFLHKYFKVTKDCHSDVRACLNPSYQPIERNRTYDVWSVFPYTYSSRDFRCAVIDSGAGICISSYSEGWNSSMVLIDTNSNNNPNITGRDFWVLFINGDGRVGGTTNLASYTGSPYCSGYSYSCASYVISNGWQMKY